MTRSSYGWKNKAVGFLLPLAVAVGTHSAQAGRIYQFSGKVAGMSNDSISLKKGSEVLEFRKDQMDAGSKDLQDVQVGDQITLWYRLDALKARSLKGSGQQPGQAAPKDMPDLENGKKKGIIQDDRAFYDARNDRKVDASVHPDG